jgi:hypothetical protein
MKTPSITLAAFALFAVGCTEPTPTSPEASTRPSIGTPSFSNQGNGVVHRVSVGGHDADIFNPPFIIRADKNFSLIAIEHGDGSVTGQWIDMFGKDADGNPVGGVHIDVDCLSVVNNQATIGGVITNGTLNGVDVTGQRALTRVWDNGKSANDPPDEISFSYFPTFNRTCTAPGFPLARLVMTDGQVTVD